MREAFLTHDAPKPIGTYSQVIKSGNLLFLAGQIGLDPKTLQLTSDDCQMQAEQIFKNIAAILQHCNSDLNHIVKLTVFLTNLEDFPLVNDLMKQLFKEPFPARTTIEVSKLPKDAVIEIEAVAVLPT